MREFNKRHNTDRIFKEKGADIILIQEAHITPEVVKLWQVARGGGGVNCTIR